MKTNSTSSTHSADTSIREVAPENTVQAPKHSFQRQLTTVFSVGIFALAIVTSLTTAWSTAKNIESQLIEDGLRVADSVAEQSILAFLYGSPENAQDAVTAALGFPSIIKVGLITLDGAELLSGGSDMADLAIGTHQQHEAKLLKDTDNSWIFVSPVYTEGQLQSDEFAILFQEKVEPELLGHVVVVKDKENLKKIISSTVINNLAIAIFIAVILLFIIKRNFKRLTKPLFELSSRMEESEKEGISKKVTPSGPKEVFNIGHAYNSMMDAISERDAQLRSHNELLEYEVNQRTADLVYARDMAIKANQNKSDFLSNVSHELRTPLQSIIGYSDLILDEVPKEMGNIRHDVETIINNANHLLNMINSVLDMSKIESGRMELQLSQVNIETLINNVIETILPLMAINNNQLNHEIIIEEKFIAIDEQKFRQILINLLSNAGKFTINGNVSLFVNQTADTLTICIEDSGIGMSEEQLEHIFEPFYQIDSGVTRRFQGTGLGLAITSQFCNLMGGDISVTSRLNQGSRFDIIIPLPIKE